MREEQQTDQIEEEKKEGPKNLIEQNSISINIGFGKCKSNLKLEHS